jgi:CheY-like chemotaxis protein
MDKPTFTSLFKDLISRLYDPTILETHPLADSFPLREGAPARRAESIRHLILSEIEQLRPPGKEILLQSPEWRPYLILHKRYVEGLPPLEVAAALYIGDRQFRRDHSRALQALSTLIWERYFQPQAGAPGNSEAAGDQNGFEAHAEKLDLNEIVQGVAALLARRLEIEAVDLDLQPAPGPREVFADRVILRQILLSLLNYVLHLRGSPEITLCNEPGPPEVMRISFEVDEQWATIQSDELDSLGLVRQLSRQIPARLLESYPPRGAAGPAEIAVEFAPPLARVALIVDDQPAAQKMYQRYLSRTDLEVIGLTDPAAAVSTARQVQPAILILDVMMPRLDGWEVLQALQLDPQTRHIPVVVCSAWGESELARSLEAAAFLKKPVIQKDLLDVLARLGIVAG